MKQSLLLVCLPILVLGGCKKTWSSAIDYSQILVESPSYTYESYGNNLPVLNKETARSLTKEDLEVIRAAYPLETIAGNGNQEERAIKLMKWIHNAVRHNGSEPYRGPSYRPGMIAYGLHTKRGVHCDIQAQIMESVFEAVGFPARRILCFPKEESKDFHSVTEAYLSEYAKWVYFDVTNEAVFRDEQGRLLNIQEIRNRLALKLPLYPSPGLNWNGKPRDMGQYINYMAKNLYRLRIHIPLGKSYVAIELNPDYRLDQKQCTVNNTGLISFLTGNPDYFWFK